MISQHLFPSDVCIEQVHCWVRVKADSWWPRQTYYFLSGQGPAKTQKVFSFFGLGQVSRLSILLTTYHCLSLLRDVKTQECLFNDAANTNTQSAGSMEILKLNVESRFWSYTLELHAIKVIIFVTYHVSNSSPFLLITFQLCKYLLAKN